MLAAKGMDELQLCQVAVAVYVLYRTVNQLRHAHSNGDAPAEYKAHAMHQMLHEAARGAHRLQASLHLGRGPGGLVPRKRRHDGNE